MRKYLLIPPLLAGLACGQRSSDNNPLPTIADPVIRTGGSDWPPSQVEQTAFRFSDDDAGKRLAKLLTLAPLPPLEPPSSAGPRERPLPAHIAQPELPPLRTARTLVRYPMPRHADPRPASPVERVPFELAGLMIERPERIEIPVGSLARLPAPDVKQPTALPILARPTADRASLEDPTADWTAASISKAKLPLRSTPAPFVKVNLPDPFEHADAAKVKTMVAEDPLTAIGNPPPPKPQ